MNRRIRLVLVTVMAVAAAPAAADFEGEIERRWVGAWVLTGVETASDCSGYYTNTEVRDRVAVSKGRHRFGPGELARVDKVNVKSERVDLFLTLGESLLVARQDGPFELYDDRTCKVQLMVDVPRALLSKGPLEPVLEVLRAAAAPFAVRQEASSSPQWNGRRREAYPEDYDLTLARHAAWLAEQQNARLVALRERVTEDAAAVVGRLGEDPSYLAGFAAGVEELRSWRPGPCGSLAGTNFGVAERAAPQERSGDTVENKAWRRGFRDGQELVFSIAVLRELNGCFVPVPAVPERAN